MTTTEQSAPVTVAYLTVAQASEYTGGIHPKTLHKALREYAATDGKRGLRGVQPGAGRRWRTRRDWIDAWLAGATRHKRKGQR